MVTKKHSISHGVRLLRLRKPPYPFLYGLAFLVLLFPLLVMPLRQMMFISQTAGMRSLEPSSGSLEKMVFTPHEFARLDFTRSDREFFYQGNMYDVYSIVHEGGLVTVMAVWDKSESLLLQASDAGSPSGGWTPADTARQAFMPYFFQDTLDFPVPPSVFSGKPDTPFRIFIKDPFLQILSPPPEWIG